MSTYDYDPDQWLVSTIRSLGSWVKDALNPDPGNVRVNVEMSFPNTRDWTKALPLARPLVHMELDDSDDPILGFGVPGVGTLDDTTDPDNPTWTFEEAAQHVLNFDVGVWTSAESGGATKRMEVMQELKNLFVPASAKIAFNTATGGVNILSFNGGRNELDRINDVPVWRALDMTLMVRVFSRHVSEDAIAVPSSYVLEEDLTIRSEDGTDKPVVTP